MRTLMVLALAVLTVMAVAQDEAKETKRYEVAVDTEDLVECVEGLADLLEKKLSGPAKDYYDVLVAKNKLYGKVGVAGGVLLVLLAIGFFALCDRAIKTDGSGELGVSTVYAIGGLISAIVGVGIFGAQIGALMAPEYFAMQKFIDTASQFMP